MLNATKDLMLPTSLIGSLPRPSWFTKRLGSQTFLEAMVDTIYREQYTDAVSVYLREQETAGLDIWASNQANIDVFPNNARDVLPLYIDYTADGSTLMNVCTNNDHDSDADGNKPAEFRYLRITTGSSAAYDVTVVPNPVPPATNDAPNRHDPTLPRDRSDPDMYIYRFGEIVASGDSDVDDLEEFSTEVLPAGVYVADIQEWRYADSNASSDYPDQICFDVTMTAK